MQFTALRPGNLARRDRSQVPARCPVSAGRSPRRLPGRPRSCPSAKQVIVVSASNHTSGARLSIRWTEQGRSKPEPAELSPDLGQVSAYLCWRVDGADCLAEVVGQGVG